MKLLFTTISLFCAVALFAVEFESTQVLPKKVRRASTRFATLTVDSQYDSQGANAKLADGFKVDVNATNITSGMEELDANVFKAYLSDHGYDYENLKLGRYDSRLESDVKVYVVGAEYGLTDKFSLGFGLPIYQASTDIKLGFQRTEQADALIKQLAADGNLEESDNLNDNLSVDGLQNKVTGMGYSRLERWQRTSPGDLIIGGKYKIYDGQYTGFAAKPSITLPTGQADDPDNLIDVPSGDGQADVGLMAIQDVYIPKVKNLVFDHYVSYTAQLLDRQKMRVQTDPGTKLSSVTENVKRDLGDIFSYGASLNYKYLGGFLTKVGYSFTYKFKDSINGSNPAADYSLMERNTRGYLHEVGAMLGYTTIDKYLSKKFPIPLDAILSYTRPVAGINNTIKNLWMLQLAMYF